MKFAIQAARKSDHEASTIAVYCALNSGNSCKVVSRAKDVELDYIPVGTVPWVEEVLGHCDKPDYYPEFLQGWLHRRVWAAEKWPYGSKVFIKPADRHKRFTGFLTSGTWKGKKKPPYWCSERVNFVTEWRWYVAAGKVIDARWGSGEESPVPDLNIEWPADYYAAVDFGQLDNGKIALVESNSPFSCGWYGPLGEGKTYVQWLAQSWEWLKSKPKK
jgi:hypothetical protein